MKELPIIKLSEFNNMGWTSHLAFNFNGQAI